MPVSTYYACKGMYKCQVLKIRIDIPIFHGIIKNISIASKIKEDGAVPFVHDKTWISTKRSRVIVLD